MATDLTRLKEYNDLTKKILGIAEKSTVEEVARVLAVHVGHYQRRYGRIAMEDTLAALHAEEPTPEQMADLAEGMECLVAVLILATDVADDEGGTA